MAGQFCSWFNSGVHADVRLHLRITQEPVSNASWPDADIGDGEQAAPEASRKRPREKPATSASSSSAAVSTIPSSLQQDAAARTYSTHAVVLAAHSNWFKAALNEPWRQQQAVIADEDNASSYTSAVSIRHELTVHVKPDEVEAMDLLLQLMYGYNLPSPSADQVPLLFTCLWLADRLESPSCVDLLLQLLKQVSIGLTMLQHVFDAPPGVVNEPAYRQLLGSCTQALIRRFGNVPAILRRDETLMSDFYSLPFAAVLAWAGSDELQVHSENCVVYLLSAWLKGSETSEQLEQLAHQVRVVHLGPSYLHQILPKLEWFKGCSGMAWMPTLLTIRNWDTCPRVGFSLNGLHMAEGFWKGPKQWLAKRRRQCQLTEADTLLKWEVDGELLHWLCAGQQICLPDPFYIGGFHVFMLAEPRQAADGAGVTLAFGCYAFQLQMCESEDAGPPGSVIFGPMTFNVFGPGQRQIDFYMADSAQQFAVNWEGGDVNWGGENILGWSAPTMTELLAPYLQGGRLCLGAVFTHIDRF